MNRISFLSITSIVLLSALLFSDVSIADRGFSSKHRLLVWSTSAFSPFTWFWAERTVINPDQLQINNYIGSTPCPSGKSIDVPIDEMWGIEVYSKSDEKAILREVIVKKVPGLILKVSLDEDSLEILSQMDSLKYLMFDISIQPKSITSILRNLISLEYLHIFNISDNSSLFPGLIKCGKLNTLSLSFSKASSRYAKYIADYIAPKCLILHDMSFNMKDMEIIASCKRLTHLAVYSQTITNEMIRTISQNRTIQYLFLASRSPCEIYLNPIGKMQQLISLSISDIASLNDEWEWVEKCKRLKRFRFYCKTSTFTCSFMNSIAKLPITHLFLSNCTPTEFEALRDNASVICLELYRTVVNEGVNDVIVTMESLATINIYGGCVNGDETMRALSQIDSMRNIRLMDPITDEGVAHLADIANLKYIEINAVNVTDIAISHLACMKTLNTIRLINCSNITSAGVSRIAEETLANKITMNEATELTDNDLLLLSKNNNIIYLSMIGSVFTKGGMNKLLLGSQVAYMAPHSWEEMRRMYIVYAVGYLKYYAYSIKKEGIKNGEFFRNREYNFSPIAYHRIRCGYIFEYYSNSEENDATMFVMVAIPMNANAGDKAYYISEDGMMFVRNVKEEGVREMKALTVKGIDFNEDNSKARIKGFMPMDNTNSRK